MPNNYATVNEVKQALPDSGLADEASYNALLTALITRASRLIDAECKRDSGAFCVPSTDETTRYYTGSGGAEQWVDEMAAAPSYLGISQGGGVQSSDYTTISSSDYFLWPDNSTPYRRIDLDTINGAYFHFYRYRRSVKVTAPFGYSTTTPDLIKQACIITVARWFKRSHQGFADASAIPELGQMMYTKALDPDVVEMLKLYGRVTV